MSKTLNFAEHLLSQGRRYQLLGRDQEALQLLNKLASLPELPGAVAEETQATLAEIHLGRRKFHRARRHLTAALLYQPNDAYYHYLMAQANEDGSRANRARASRHYRESLRLDPDQPQCLVDYGQFLLDQGATEEGLKQLRRAVELCPAHPEYLRDLVEGLESVEQFDEARSALRRAMFQNGRDYRFKQLWRDFEFRELRRSQEQARHATMRRRTVHQSPMLLPFVRLVTTPKPLGVNGKIIRRDPPTPIQPPHQPKRSRVTKNRVRNVE
jgi:tetratricopeptide (TPR) repeat protein